MARVVVRKGYRCQPGKRREVLASLQRIDAVAAAAGYPRGRYLFVETRALGEPDLEVEFVFDSYAEMEQLERRMREHVARFLRDGGSAGQDLLLEPSATRYLLLVDDGPTAAPVPAGSAAPDRTASRPAPTPTGAPARAGSTHMARGAPSTGREAHGAEAPPTPFVPPPLSPPAAARPVRRLAERAPEGPPGGLRGPAGPLPPSGGGTTSHPLDDVASEAADDLDDEAFDEAKLPEPEVPPPPTIPPGMTPEQFRTKQLAAARAVLDDAERSVKLAPATSRGASSPRRRPPPADDTTSGA